ncbi:MAG TPA: SIS domain-containing protein [Sphingomonas sp.]|nr:SIS domain-containing protein [Sphingomonas sp.]HMI19263.1 SIS domain-containing protein [Sphingomonas sp.]
MSHSLSSQSTLMFAEAAEAASAVRRQHARNAEAVTKLGETLRTMRPRVFITLARGSSDNAATFARYLVETQAGVLTSSASPSIASVYDAAPPMQGAVMLAISQSGRSPDLVASATAAKEQGAFLISLVNDEDSPLFALADAALPLCAGPEKSVAATKSFIATLAAILHIVAEWTQDARIARAVTALPDLLDRAWTLDWSPALPVLDHADHLYVVGRGHGFGVAQEMALKFKETCGVHAEAFSAAEVRHGPMALVGPGFPVLLTAQDDESQASVQSLAAEFAARHAPLLVAGLKDAPGTTLPALDADALVQPILLVQSFYRMVNELAVARGRDPDRPPTLAKVTETV